jgi:glycosyltransferase involved in cell wall biosynthesis
LRLLRFDKPYTFVFSPNWGPYVQSLQYRNLIYYCVDEHAGFKGVNSQKFAEWDQYLSSTADHVFCTAENLYQKKRPLNANTHYMPHGVNWGLFSKAMDSTGKIDPTLEQLDGPILLFFGHISYDWVDTALIRFIASQRPKWHIVLVGRNSVDPLEFDKHENIHLLGEREYEDLPTLCRYASIGIIPFVDSELTAACNPLKLYEYLAAGLPVVSTDIPEVRRYSDIVHIGSTQTSFLTACEQALHIDRIEYSPKASELVREHDWDSRVQNIYALITA